MERNRLQRILRAAWPRVLAIGILLGIWQLLVEVGRLAKEDESLRVRRYAVNVLRAVAELAKAQKLKPAG